MAVLLVLSALAVTGHAIAEKDYKNLQNQVVSLQGTVQHLLTELGDLRQHHTQLEYKYNTLSDELRYIRTHPRELLQEDLWNHQPSKRLKEPERHAYRNTPTKGQKGDNGDIGKPGPKGDNGLPGFNGDDGLDGTQGQKGDVGVRGPKGDNGLPGLNGDDGRDGSEGAKGEPGKSGQASKVGFSARMSHKLQLLGGMVRVLKFDLVGVSHGSDYNPTSGVFVCGIPGTYVVTWALEIGTTTTVSSSLMKNGYEIGRLTVTGLNGVSNTGSQIALVTLDVNDHLYISATPKFPGVTIENSSSFTLFLLYK
ncbi:otolin-1-like [Pecten maximus]|uniref:otolin-1-like n=1 Tax=Pecten maximus TaxID=6579 RepID=UPI0014588E67|nr:otolin-1-like [Pecten maximus]